MIFFAADKKLPEYPAVKKEVLAYLKRVSEAKRLAFIQLYDTL